MHPSPYNDNPGNWIVSFINPLALKEVYHSRIERLCNKYQILRPIKVNLSSVISRSISKPTAINIAPIPKELGGYQDVKRIPSRKAKTRGTREPQVCNHNILHHSLATGRCFSLRTARFFALLGTSSHCYTMCKPPIEMHQRYVSRDISRITITLPKQICTHDQSSC